jgi:hypothetical protein
VTHLEGNEQGAGMRDRVSLGELAIRAVHGENPQNPA